MFNRIMLRVMIVFGTLGIASAATAQDRVHNYFNDAALKVKATNNPVEKREILSKNLDQMTQAVESIKSAPLVTDQDRAHLDRLEATLRDKSDELAGVNGFERVPDDQLNAFSTYVVQDMEQAEQTITISVVVLLLIIIIILLIA